MLLLLIFINMLDISSVTSSNRDFSKDNYPCIICGRPCHPLIKNYVHATNGSMNWVAAYEDNFDESGDMGFWPIGSGCLKKCRNVFPDFDQYVIKI